jgi:putative oxidoreductase
MERYLGRYSEVLYALLRFVSGVLFACHGAQKLFGALGGQQMTSNPLMLAAGIIEFFGGLMIALGLLTGFAAFLASGEMAVAYFMMHAKGGFWPIVNKGEPAVIYCLLFLYIASRGSGPYSLDSMLFRGRPRPATARPL